MGKNIALWALVILSLLLSTVSYLRVRDVEKGLGLQQIILQDIQKATLRPPSIEHHYRFERNGASLWRYDETTGESCQITSNQIDKWSGGRCTTTSDQSSTDLDFFKALCSDPTSKSCRDFLAEGK